MNGDKEMTDQQKTAEPCGNCLKELGEITNTAGDKTHLLADWVRKYSQQIIGALVIQRDEKHLSKLSGGV